MMSRNDASQAQTSRDVSPPDERRRSGLWLERRPRHRLALEQDTPSAASRWWVGGIVVLVAVIVVMSFEALSLALPTMMVSMRVGLNEISWTITGYMISRTLFVGATGWLGNRLGNRNLFVFSLAVFTGGACLCGLAWSFEALVLFRIVQGIGAGPLVPLIMVVLNDTFPPQQRGLAQSLYMVGDAIGSILGRGLAGYVIEYLGWRMVFYSLVPLGVLSLLALLVIVPNQREAREQVQTIDLLGMLFLTGFVLCLFIGLQQGAKYGWESASVQTLLLIAGASLVAFIVTETTISAPFVDLRLLRHRAFSLICVVSCCNIVGLMGAFFLTPLMLQRLLGFSPAQAGLMLIPGAVAWGVIGPLGGKLSDVLDARLIVGGGFVLTIWTLLHFAAVTMNTPAATLVMLTTAMFCSTAVLFTPITVVGMRTVPVSSLRMGMGMINLLRGLTAVVAVALLSLVIETRQEYHGRLLAQNQSQHELEVEPVLDRLSLLFRARGELEEMAAYKARAALNNRMHTEATVLAYQECYFGLAVLYGCTLVPLLGIGRRYTRPSRTASATVEATEA
jgi:DHA2 family multidrug resistance protein